MSKKIKVARPHWDGDVLKVTFTDNEVVSFDAANLPESVKRAAFEAGIVNRLFAAFSPAQGQLNLAKECGAERWKEMVSGEFRKQRQGAPAASTLDRLIQAVVLSYKDRGKDVSPVKIRPQIEAMDRSARAALKRVPGVAFHFNALSNKGNALDDMLVTE